jgi:hypothetical protein
MHDMHDITADTTSMNIPLRRVWGGKRQAYPPWPSREIMDGVLACGFCTCLHGKVAFFASRANERGKRMCERSIQIDNNRQMEQRGCID